MDAKRCFLAVFFSSSIILSFGAPDISMSQNNDFFNKESVKQSWKSPRKFGLPVEGQSSGSPWPMPQKIETTDDVFLLVGSEDFTFTLTGTDCHILHQAALRYRDIIFIGNVNGIRKVKHVRDDVAAVDEITINIGSCPDVPALDDDESYILDVQQGTCMLKANTIWGALRGLETFSQLIYLNAEGLNVLNKTHIEDHPRFSHRGMLVDTSRHFIPVPILLQNLDAMAYNKLNVFHWHIVDFQAFPYESSTFPFMSAQGAYSNNHIYTQFDVETIIEYARFLGIRVMPEFDTPGHTLSWGSVKDLLTPCYSGGKPDGSFGPINPTLNSTYTFLAAFFKEISSVFPDHYVHMGGDEVSFACWKSNPDITKFMVAQGFGTNYSKLEEYYEQKLLEIMGGLNSGYAVWQEVIDNNVKVRSDTIVEVWLPKWQNELAKVTAKGYRALLSSTFYLNRVSSPYAQHWKKFYGINLTNFTGSDAQKKLVIGGELCMWGEFVDGTNLISRTWPRGSAVAERLWSDVSVNNVVAAVPRIAEHRCRMLRRGIQAEPVTGPGFCAHEFLSP